MIHSFLPAEPIGTFPEITMLFVPYCRSIFKVFLVPLGTVLERLTTRTTPVSGVSVTFAAFPRAAGFASTMTVLAS